MKPDLTYRTTGLFTRFMPETKAGELPWTHMGANGVVLTIHLDSTLRQLREVGYTVDVEALAAELSA